MADSGVMSAPADEYQQMAQMLTGHWVSQTLRVAADMSLTEHLADNSLTAAEVANARAAHRIPPSG
jgi:hypothetical protein